MSSRRGVKLPAQACKSTPVIAWSSPTGSHNTIISRSFAHQPIFPKATSRVVTVATQKPSTRQVCLGPFTTMFLNTFRESQGPFPAKRPILCWHLRQGLDSSNTLHERPRGLKVCGNSIALVRKRPKRALRHVGLYLWLTSQKLLRASLTRLPLRGGCSTFCIHRRFKRE